MCIPGDESSVCSEDASVNMFSVTMVSGVVHNVVVDECLLKLLLNLVTSCNTSFGSRYCISRMNEHITYNTE